MLSQSAAHPELRGNVGNIALLQRAEAAGCCRSAWARAADAYREFRHLQHRARLDESSTQLDPAPLQHQIDAVRALWTHVLG